jgi:hypothetical protein
MDHDGLDKAAWFLNAYPDMGPAWRAAIELGIDVALLEANLELTVEERFAQLLSMTRLAEELEAARERRK